MMSSRKEDMMLKLENVSKFYYNKGMITSGFTRVNLELKIGEFVVITGESGSGKSTLLNMLDANLNLQTGEVSHALGRGKHTTRHVELIPILGGLVADTPGFSALDFKDYEEYEIRDGFIEFSSYSDTCRYRDCMHRNEEECGVKEALKNGDILSSRYENYIKFLDKR